MQHFDQRQILLLENAYYQVCDDPHVYMIYFCTEVLPSVIHQNVRRGRKSSARRWFFLYGI